MARMVTFLFGAAAGAAAGYFFDPATGARRRHQTRDQAFAKARRRRRQAVRQATYAAGVAHGVAHKMAPTTPAGEPPDDITLAHKVETEIFRAPDAPKGRVSVNAENGVVFLRGALDDPQWIARLGDEASRVPGVSAVRNLLHAPSAPAPAAPPHGAPAPYGTTSPSSYGAGAPAAPPHGLVS
jgi:BON domain-containing protein